MALRSQPAKTGQVSIDRRGLLKAGGVLAGSLAGPCMQLPGETRRGSEAPRADAVIVLWMAGGVTHIDSFDPKPQAPVEVRGTLSDIPTRLPGVHFSEVMPRLAELADQFALLRSYSHDSNDHLLSQVYTLSGRKVDAAHLFTEPNLGSIVAHVHGPRDGLPAYIAVPGITRPGPPPHNLFVGGWLGSQYAPYCLGGLPEQADFTVGEKLDDPPARVDEDLVPRSLTLDPESGLPRLRQRRQLRQQLDEGLRHLEHLPEFITVEARYRDALNLLSRTAIRQAFDVTAEPHSVREQYGRTKLGGRCLMARRLVEAGARFVMVDYGYDPDYGNVWDNHNAPSQNHPPIQEMCQRGYHLAGMDRAFAALLQDLQQRGRLERTLVVFLTEFGRTPHINSRGGRDHWGAAGSLFFAGGGVQPGQVIGATDRHASQPTTRPYGPADIAASIYAALGIDHQQMIHDLLDRPRPILDHGQVISELFS